MAIATAVPQLILYTTIYPQYVAKVLGMTYSQSMRPVLISGLGAVLVTGLTGFLLHQWVSPWTWKMLIINIGIIILVNVAPILIIIEKKDMEKIKNLFHRK
jgi:hypothetical protein